MPNLEETLSTLEGMLPKLNWGVRTDTDKIICCSDLPCTLCKFYENQRNYIPCRLKRGEYLEKLREQS